MGVYLKLNSKDGGQLLVRYGLVQSAPSHTPLPKRLCPAFSMASVEGTAGEDLPIPQSIHTQVPALHRTDSSESFESVVEEEVSQQQNSTLHLDDNQKHCEE